jgi:NAD(P)H-flavin reductase
MHTINALTDLAAIGLRMPELGNDLARIHSALVDAIGDPQTTGRQQALIKRLLTLISASVCEMAGGTVMAQTARDALEERAYLSNHTHTERSTTCLTA